MALNFPQHKAAIGDIEGAILDLQTAIKRLNAIETTPSASNNTAMLQLLCDIKKHLEVPYCCPACEDFCKRIYAVLAQQQHG